MTNKRNQWRFGFLLPNLSIKEPVDTEYISIAPSNDPRVQTLVTKQPVIDKLVNSFTDQFSRKVKPSLLIFRNDIPDISLANNALVDFRNIFAITCIISAWQNYLIRRQWFIGGQYSEYYDFYPIVPRTTDNYLSIISPAVLGIDDPQLFSGQTAPELAGPTYNIECDTYLFDPLITIWKERYVHVKLSDLKSIALFRSLQIAFQACTIPRTNYTSIYDYGARISQWVSAFEILAHPNNQRVGLKNVQKILGRFPSQSRQLTRRLYTIYKDNQGITRGTLPQKLYYQIYKARNDFIHGNPVSTKHLFPWYNSNKPPLNYFTPLLYKVILICLLDIYPNSNIYSQPFEILKSIIGLENSLLSSIDQT